MITYQPVNDHEDSLKVVDRQPPNRVTGQTAFGEFTRLGSQIEMSKTPEYWADPIVCPIGSSKPEWLPR